MHVQVQKHGFKTLLLASLAVTLSACGGMSDKYQNTGEINDPFEKMNRTTLAVNDAVDKAVLEPVARGYRAVTPSGIRIAFSNFLNNLKSPVVIGNQLLQGDMQGAGNATARMVINTLAGFGGILDLADAGGIEDEPEDFGQTLATWGVGDGAYVVLPFMGPSSVRDTAGMFVDGYADPLRIYLFNIDKQGWHYGRIGGTVLSERERLLDVIDDLRRNSFDYYAAMRSAYYQNRQALINDSGRADAAVIEIPEYDDF